VLDSSHESGALCLLSGQNILLEVTEDKSIRIHSAGNPGGGEDPNCNCPEMNFGEGFIVTENTEDFVKKKDVILDTEYINEQLILPALEGITHRVAALE
jgi:hypothetical protein